MVSVMRNLLFTISISLCILLTACGNDSSIGIIGGADGPTSIIVAEKGEKAMYEQITAENAKKIMDSGEEHIILDTREQDEFDSGHIPGAILIPYTEIENKAEEIIPDKDKLILVYCRSGRRSKIAAESLAKLGYTNVKEFGGIIDWPYEVEE
ncbi:MAG: rhodanese-like domain-containing protein [Clostridia bacterium]|nr:rhodanese-like domain-containing protein [Clostridia bacterium]